MSTKTTITRGFFSAFSEFQKASALRFIWLNERRELRRMSPKSFGRHLFIWFYLLKINEQG